MPEFQLWVKNKFNLEDKNSLPNGILYLKGGNLTQELQDVNYYKEFLLKNIQFLF